ncbi:DUF4390 domain-containing protein [Spiribacter salilacus]|nr:DUF4390 domain-containing protein [Spiribacter salilacus]
MAFTTLACAKINRWAVLQRFMLGCVVWALAGTALSSGDFRVDNIVPRFEAELLSMDAQLTYRLSEKADQALTNGLPLEIQQTLQVQRKRKWWFNAAVVTQQRHYRIQFHALSRRYVLTRLETGASRSFRDRQALLSALGRIEGWPVMRESAVQALGPIQLRLTTKLVRDALPRVLRMAAWLDADWQLRGGPLVKEVQP